MLKRKIENMILFMNQRKEYRFIFIWLFYAVVSVMVILIVGSINALYWQNKNISKFIDIVSSLFNLCNVYLTAQLYFKLHLKNVREAKENYEQRVASYERLKEYFPNLEPPTDYAKKMKRYEIIYCLCIVFNLLFAYLNLFSI